MNWKKNIYDTLTSCATLCDEAATTASQAKDIENHYRFIFLNLDCADICRQVAMLYVRGSENTRLLAETCIEICEKCVEEAGRVNTDQARQVVVICLQTIQSCVAVLRMDTPADRPMPTVPTPASLFYGIDLRETFYN